MGIRQDERLLHVALPAKLIRRLDRAVIEGRGEFETRSEFVREAVENLLLELEYDPAPPEPPRSRRVQETQRHAENGADGHGGEGFLRADDPSKTSGALEKGAVAALGLSATALRAPSRGAVIDDGVAKIADEPLFGLHNRDFPSFWAAVQLAEITHQGPAPFSDCLDELVERAWRYADELREIEEATGEAKLRVMFPTNRDKRQSAEEGFKTFAVGTATRGPDHSVIARGPLFSWRICQLQRDDSGLLIALTSRGYELLEALDGISLATPHPRGTAERFFGHLRQWSMADWRGFEILLDGVSREPDRAGLVAHFKAARSDWSNAVAATNSQGYVGRAREWGLVEPKQVKSRYLLTEFGRNVLDGRS